MTKGKIRVPTKHVPEETITRGTKNVLVDLGIVPSIDEPTGHATGHEEDNRTESDD